MRNLYTSFWDGFLKMAASKFKLLNSVRAPAPLTGLVEKVPFAGKTERVLNYKDMYAAQRAQKMRPHTSINYEKVRSQWEAAKPQGGTITYGKKGKVTSTAPGTPTVESKAIAQQKAKEHSQKVIANATKGGYSQPQFERVGLVKQNTP